MIPMSVYKRGVLSSETSSHRRRAPASRPMAFAKLDRGGRKLHLFFTPLLAGNFWLAQLPMGGEGDLSIVVPPGDVQCATGGEEREIWGRSGEH